MISPDPRPPAALARWAESYEAKYERRQETRESRRCRPNMTTCRQMGKALRTQHTEQLQRARQQQFFRRRNLEVEEKDKAQTAPVREQSPSRRTGQGAELKKLLAETNKIPPPREQVGMPRDTPLCGGMGGLQATKKSFKLSLFFLSVL